jgi:hypothetical protein
MLTRSIATPERPSAVYKPYRIGVPWNDTVRGKWGSLKRVTIVDIKRLAPLRDVYTVDTEMEYEHGRTSGRFLFTLEQQKATLLSALLVNPTGKPTGGG